MPISELDLMFGEEIKEQTSSQIRKSVSKKDIRVFASSLARLLEGGLPILRALELTQKEFQRSAMKNHILDVIENIRQGKNLSEALAVLPCSFPHYFIPMIRAGEMSGNLDTVLQMLTFHLEREEESNRKIREAMAYPTFVLVLGFSTIIFLLKFVMPRMATVYSNFGHELPFITRLLMGIGNLIFPLLGAAAVLIGLGIFVMKKQKESIQSFIVQFTLKIPIVEDLVRKILLCRFASLLSLELTSGIPILQAIDSVAGTSSIQFFRRDLTNAGELLSQGKSLSGSLQGIAWMDESAHALIVSGEESGRMPEVLAQIEKTAQREVDSKIHFMLKLLEPLMILGVGVVIGFIVVSTFLPIFEINDLVR